MKAEQLSGAMEHFSDALLREADASRKTKKSPRRWLGWAAAAACIGIIGTVGLAQLHGNRQNAAPGEIPGQNEESGWMSYAGPMLSLCLPEENGNITARRQLTLDFVAGQQGGWDGSCQVTDVYTLYNTGDTDADITLEYPYADSLRNVSRPTVFVDGAETAYETAVGESLGLSGSVNQWEQYGMALADGSYLHRAMESVPALEQTAVVYFVTETSVVSTDETGAPTLDLHFRKNAETAVLSYGFNGGVYGDTEGWEGRNFFLPRQGSADAQQLRCLIVLGGDLEQLTVQGYVDGGLTKRRDDLTATVTRQEMSLEQALSLALEDMYRRWDTNEDESWPPEGISREDCMAQVRRAMPEFLEETREGGDTGELELLFTHVHGGGKRVLYCGVTLHIPAGGTVQVTVCYSKAGSYDYPGTGDAREGVRGFDGMVTPSAGLNLTEQTAVLRLGDGLEIVSQSFGFDPDADASPVTLDAGQEVYSLEVREKTAK